MPPALSRVTCQGPVTNMPAEAAAPNNYFGAPSGCGCLSRSGKLPYGRCAAACGGSDQGQGPWCSKAIMNRGGRHGSGGMPPDHPRKRRGEFAAVRGRDCDQVDAGFRACSGPDAAITSAGRAIANDGASSLDSDAPWPDGPLRRCLVPADLPAPDTAPIRPWQIVRRVAPCVISSDDCRGRRQTNRPRPNAPRADVLR